MQAHIFNCLSLEVIKESYPGFFSAKKNIEIGKAASKIPNSVEEIAAHKKQMDTFEKTLKHRINNARVGHSKSYYHYCSHILGQSSALFCPAEYLWLQRGNSAKAQRAVDKQFGLVVRATNSQNQALQSIFRP